LHLKNIASYLTKQIFIGCSISGKHKGKGTNLQVRSYENSKFSDIGCFANIRCLFVIVGHEREFSVKQWSRGNNYSPVQQLTISNHSTSSTSYCPTYVSAHKMKEQGANT